MLTIRSTVCLLDFRPQFQAVVKCWLTFVLVGSSMDELSV